MGLKYSINNIKKHKLMCIIIVIQIILGLFSTYLMLNSNKLLDKEIKKIDTVLNSGNVYSIVGNWDYYDFLKEYDSKKIYNDINSIEGLQFMSMLDIAMNVFFEDINIFKGIDLFYPDNNYVYIEGVAIDETSVSNFDLEVEQGRFFTQTEYEDLKGEVLPIILGYDFKNIFSVGDIIEFDVNNIKKIEIIGFLQKGQELPHHIGKNVDYKDKIIKLDNKVITTKRFLGEDSIYRNLLINSYLYIDTKKIDSIKSKVKEIFNNEEIEVNLRSEKQGIDLTINELKEQKEVFSVTTVVIITFTALTIILTLLNSIESRKQELGTYLLCGAKFSDLSNIIIYELVMINLVAFLFFILLAKILLGSVVYTILIPIGMFCIAYTLILSIVPILKLRRYSIRDLIKGEE